ncbi:conserved hypothetical protein (plasmid) [Pseudarthrobacter chlorophenolicus A6]|uniref:IrrE N-terminal-like domain-containing protein n=1 Tax=Pseudarthrobacter chlorophenolicus (strain ATCC 700700 / DSM 12829 / CIP 107037 / JCM 12360 / KCTC 9906 / NCIMB 13794 / A6) TaxID=452863 RepID=B8HIB5_PSECP|nr:hypothetical protein [Pseudarthrobacter chlorophenolicus]ACL42162.1 conserved hypothetical protein [Pseudarthrobacter chlorophenolicus A6]SDQ14255.1 hypothetical protein SAMN04489738_0269 [Pseudarthrobacter chlorophenolicus]
MDYAAARERARTAELQLNLTEPVSLQSTHRHLEKMRGRPIEIQAMDGPEDQVCGLWFGLDDADLILHARAASEVHRQQIVLHEFAHMILRHEQEELAPEVARNFFPDLDPGRVIKALKRTDFMDEFEVTAELLADRLAARIRRSQRRAAGQPGNFGSVFG